MSDILNIRGMKQLAAEHGRSLSAKAIEVFRRHLTGRTIASCGLHDGGRKSVSEDAAAIAVRNGKL